MSIRVFRPKGLPPKTPPRPPKTQLTQESYFFSFFFFKLSDLEINLILKIIKNSEFKSNFLRTLTSKHHTKIYHTNAGVYPKVSLIERVIRTIKSLFFQYLLEFGTLRWVNIIRLIQNVYNNRSHSGIFNLRPVQAHFDTHITAYLSRRNAVSARRHKSQAQSLFAQQESRGNALQIRDYVLLKLKPKIIRKESSILNPTYSKKAYQITDVDTSQHPFLYGLSGFRKDQTPPRRFYSFELLKVERDFNTINNNAKTTIKDFKITDLRALRSGRSIDDVTTGQISYLISKKGEPDHWISEETLRLMKTSFGENNLQYDPKFFSPENKRLIV